MPVYVVYQLTNLINGKIYVGRHKTTSNINDGYLGSGSRLKYAKKKYGVEAFEKTILGVHNSLQDAIDHEASIVTEEFLQRSDVYNVQPGGRGGGWDSVNSQGLNLRTGAVLSNDTKQKISLSNTGKIRTSEQREKISGDKNGMKTQAARVKLATSLRGRTLSPEHRANIAKSLRKR